VKYFWHIVIMRITISYKQDTHRLGPCDGISDKKKNIQDVFTHDLELNHF